MSNSTNSKMFWVHCLSPLHVGAGRGVSYIDLPIMREKTTNWPFVPGSSIKGVIAEKNGASITGNEPRADANLIAAFGNSDDNGDGKSANSGSLVFSDASIACLPVRSVYGTFAWVTSPMVLMRMKRDIDATGVMQEAPNIQDIISVSDEKIYVCNDSVIKDSENEVGKKVYLEDLDLTVDTVNHADNWACLIAQAVFGSQDDWKAEFKKRFCIVADDVFSFLCQTATQIDARIRIKPQTKSVASGALWYEESLPVETILYGTVWCDKVYTSENNKPTMDLLDKYCKSDLYLQMGGHSTIGRGRVKISFCYSIKDGDPK